ncbi:MAG TPA: adenylate/guanylate cyclase domain-containing protein [Acidimicrobiia bacterium]|nr:adenylate/guanylate cyclase domain-containing protein [Acidimicrobiia bacterium]
MAGVKFTRSADGTEIAWAERGEGEPFIVMPPYPVSHVQLEWEQPQGEIYRRVSERARLIRLDPRGVGMSSRTPPSFALDRHVEDLAAVMDAAGVETCALMAMETGAFAPTTFAARHPERIRHLVLVNPFLRVSDFLQQPQTLVLTDLLLKDWELFSETIGGVAFGFGRQEAQTYGAFYRACVTQDVAGSLIRESLQTETMHEDLASVRAPTLVIRHRELKLVTTDMVREAVAFLADPTYVEVGGRYADSIPETVDRALEFTGMADRRGTARSEATEPLPTGTVTFLLTDIVGSTELWDRAAAEMGHALRRHDELVGRAVEQHHGTLVKSKGEGDSSLSVFARASDAAAAAAAIQSAIASEAWPGDCAISIRAGLHTGEAEVRDGDYYGPTVNRAARLRGLAGGGQVVLSAATAALVADHLPDGCSLVVLGEHALKGLRRPEQVHELRGAW